MSLVNLIKNKLKKYTKKKKVLYYDVYVCNIYRTVTKITVSTNEDKIWNCTLRETTEGVNTYFPIINEETISIINNIEPSLITIVKEFGMDDNDNMKDFLREYFLKR